MIETEPSATIDEIQIWSHGTFGNLVVNNEWLDEDSFDVKSRYHEKHLVLAKRLRPNSLIWFRTCATFGSRKGQSFAKRISRLFNCRVAGYTYNIGPIQSGLHSINPGEEATWSDVEGIKEGTATDPKKGKASSIFAPNSISCLRGTLPRGW